MDTNKGMMEVEARARGMICSMCRQRLSTTTDGTPIQCHACKTVNRIPGYGRSSSKDDGKTIKIDEFAAKVGKTIKIDEFAAKVGKTIKIDEFAAKVRKKISHHHHQHSGSKKLKSLNCSPSPLALDASQPFSSVVRLRPRKRALLIGVTYKKWKHRLKGTVNDVMIMKDFLITNFDFQRENILILADQEPEPDLVPSKKNIQNALQWLVRGCKSGDSLVFYFSGHGLRQPDFEGDELDGYDETICPIDFLEEGMISDNEINSTIVRPLPKGVTLHAIVDACHSGTILDLLHVYNRDKKEWEDNKPPSGNISKHTNGGLAISISACEDNQVAADTSAFVGKAMSGALTYILVNTLKENPKITYGVLIENMHQALDNVNLNRCLPSKILSRVLNNRILQKPQLSASEPFDVNKKLFIL